MLVLTRKLQEMIKIGDEITVTVLKVKGNLVRLGIEAPRSVRVLRSELPRVAEGTCEESTERPPVAEAVADIAPEMLSQLEESEFVQPPVQPARKAYNQRRPRFAMPEVRSKETTASASIAK